MKIKKRILFWIIGIVLLGWSAMFITDVIRCSSLKAPVFVIAGDTADDGGSGDYYGLGYTVKAKKFLSVEHGVCIESLELYFMGKLITASIR